MSQPCVEDARSKTPLITASHRRDLSVCLVASGVPCQGRLGTEAPQSRSHARFNGFGQGDLWTRTHR